MKTLPTRDLAALGFLTFALFLGAGNIIFPPRVGLGAGEHLWSAALGFLLTGVGLPLLTVVALARAGGGLQALTAPLGKAAGMALGVAVYLAIGPLFATPRTATVSFELGMAPLLGSTPSALFGYSLGYFALVALLSLYPGKLVDIIGRLLTPVLILALGVLGAGAWVLPAGALSASAAAYQSHTLALGQGFVQGYQTMDALAALVFGMVIVHAIKDSGVTDARLHTRYAIIAAGIAALGLGLVYVSLIYLGATSATLVDGGASGVRILTAYVQHTFGAGGMGLLTGVILLACLTTCVGLVSACATYFGQLLPLSYRSMVLLLSGFSLVVANQGLEQLIGVAGPVLLALYPVAIALVALSLLPRCWQSASRVYGPVLGMALLLGVADGLQAAALWHMPAWLARLPGAAMGMAWLLPVGATLLLAALADRALPAPMPRMA